jgi:hypothetical protein
MRLNPTLPLCLLALAASVAARAAPPDEATPASYRHASECVAVLKRDALGLVEASRASQPGARASLLRLTEQGFAFVGTAYKAGLRNPLADQLLAEAEQAQQRWPAERLRQLATDCQGEGATLLKQSNFIERALVSNRAKARVEHLLTPAVPPSPAAAPPR